MEDMLVSVIIPTYKRKWEMIERAINSVLSQTYKNFEIILVDDSPSDYSERYKIKNIIQDKAYKNVKYIQHEVNKGACAARNTGISNANGELIAFLDDDDEWLENKLEMQVKEIQIKNVDLVSCGFFEVIEQENGGFKINKYINEIEEKNFINLLNENFIGSTSLVLMKRQCLEICGGFNEELKSCQDWELWLRIIQKFKIEYLKYPLVKYHVHRLDRITTNFKKSMQGYEFIQKKYLKFYESNNIIMKSHLYRICEIQANAGMFEQAFKSWKQASKIMPYEICKSSKIFLKILKIRLFKKVS